MEVANDADHSEADRRQSAVSQARVSDQPCTDQRANLGRPSNADQLDVRERYRHLEADVMAHAVDTATNHLGRMVR